MNRQWPNGSSRGALLITPGERKALQLLANGHTTNDMAAGLGVSTREIETLLTTLFATMGVAGRGDAVAAAVAG